MSTETETPPKERSVPKPVFTDAEAGSQEFPSSTSRSYNYFTPAKRRATIYEDVTVDVQPDPERHLTQGWIYGFADGTSGYPQEWSALKSSNWHEFLDPNEEWEQTIYRNNANVVRQAQSNIANAKDAHAFAQWSRQWVDVVAKHVGAWAHAEHGLGMHVYMPANRDAPTNMINNALSVGAVHKLRFAQDLILYNLDLDDEIEGFDGQAHIKTWQEDPIWQKTRENVEKLTATRDWSEAFFATAVVFEPLDRRAVPQRLRDAGRRAAGRLRHPDAVRLGRVGHHARAARGAAAVRDARQRRAARRGEQEDDAGLAGGVDAGEHRGRAHDAADLVAARREGDHVRGVDGALEPALRRPALGHRTRDPQGGVNMADNDRYKFDRTSSNRAGVTLMNNQVGHTVADVMRGHDNVTVEELPSMIRVDGTGQFDFNYEEIAEALGWADFGNDDFEEIMSTHYGRMVVEDDRVIMFANPEDAAEYIDFDLKVVN